MFPNSKGRARGMRMLDTTTNITYASNPVRGMNTDGHSTCGQSCTKAEVFLAYVHI